MFAQAKHSSTSHHSRSKQTSTPFFQTKLKVGKANSPAEKEADNVALRVVDGKNGAAQETAEPVVQRFFTPMKMVARKEEEVQAKPKKDPEEILKKEEVGSKGGAAPDGFSNKLQALKGGGEQMPQNVQAKMERGIGADFSGVRIHNNPAAAELNQSIQAKAFTVGSDIAFNKGQYNPQSRGGQLLLAHELTHTVQQGASQARNNTVQRKSKGVQRGYFGRAWGAVKGAVSGAASWAADRLNEGINWLKNKARTFVSNINGYFALTVILGKDPITGNTVAQTGANFIKAALDFIPGGSWLWEKIKANGVAAEAGVFLEKQLAIWNLDLPGVISELAAIWRSLGISDVRNPKAVLTRVGNVFLSRIKRTITFAVNIGLYFVGLVKRFVIKALAEHVKKNTRFYPLLQQVLGYDPISDEKVDSSARTIIKALMFLTPQGEAIYKQLEQSGAMAKAELYVAKLKGRVLTLIAMVKANALKIWSKVTWKNLFSPIETFTSIANLFLNIVKAVVSFVAGVVLDFLTFVKEALMALLEKFADKIPGFYLLTVVLGRNPVSGKKVVRTPQKLIKGFLKLIPGGTGFYKQIKESGALDRVAGWITGAVTKLGLVFTAVKKAVIKLWNSFSWSDLTQPVQAFKRVINIISQPIKRILDFLVFVIEKIIMVILMIMQFPIDLAQRVVSKVKMAFKAIVKNPISFIKNILFALQKGFGLFFKNIKKHLISGVTSWLFGQLKTAGIEPPKDFTFKSILKMIMQVMGITIQNIWARIKKKIGPEKAARLEKMKDRLTGAWSFISDVIKNGPSALWAKIKEKLSNLWTLVKDGIRNWIVTKIITQVTARIALMLNPAGALIAVINAFIALFTAIQTLIQKIRDMLQIIGSMADSVLQIARGNVAAAATFIEASIAKVLPVVITFLANYLGLGGLGKKISEMVTKVQGLVNKAIDWFLDKAIKLGKGLLSGAQKAVKAVGSRIKNWWKARRSFKTKDQKEHKLYFKGTGASAKLTIESTPTNFTVYINNLVKANALKKGDTTDVLAAATKLDTEKAKPVPTEKAKAEQHNENINNLLDTLVNNVLALPIASSGTNTPIIYGPLHQEMGIFASVAYREAPHKKGTTPGVPNHKLFTTLNMRKHKKGSFYVKGHLINEYLGGSGLKWQNLTPLSRTGNKQHQLQFEDLVKEAVNGSKSAEETSGLAKTGSMKNFKVTAIYGRGLSTKASQLDNDTNTTLKNGEIAAASDVKKLLIAEQHVPTRLECSAVIEKGDGKEKTVKKPIDNPIDYGNLSEYQLTAAADEVYSFKDKLAGLTTIKAKMEKLRGDLNGITLATARKIIDAVAEGKTINNYTTQIGISKESLETANKGVVFVFKK